ncbi:amino acid-binding protein [Solicola sp. PLA-1-18]|uniref:amino acid-binding protein n=1 Tax=Solicola sp. PLA-1-18 TaxID=3380532 RepID=UPI003B775DC2
MNGAPVDVAAVLDDRAGALAELGECLGAAGVSLEGGGVFVHDGVGVAHFLVDDGAAARAALRAEGIVLTDVREPVVLRLDQGVPGQLGLVCRQLADAGVSIQVQYSDHDGRLVLLVPDADVAAAREVAARW